MNVRRVMLIRLDFVLSKDSERLRSELEEIYKSSEEMISSGIHSGGRTLRFERTRYFDHSEPSAYELSDFDEISSIVLEDDSDYFINVITAGFLSDDLISRFSEVSYSERGRLFQDYREALSSLVNSIPTLVDDDEFSPAILYAEPEEQYTVHSYAGDPDGEGTLIVDDEKVKSFLKSNEEELRNFRFNHGGYISIINKSYIASPEGIQNFWGPIVLFKLGPTLDVPTHADKWEGFMHHIFRDGIYPFSLLFKIYHWENQRHQDLEEIDVETYSWEAQSTSESQSLLIPKSLKRVSALREIRDSWVSTFIQTVDERDELHEQLFRVNEENPVEPLEVQDEEIRLGDYDPPAEEVSLLSKYRMDMEEKLSLLDRDLNRIRTKLDDLSRMVHDRANVYLQNRVYWLTIVLALLTLILVILTVILILNGDGSAAEGLPNQSN